MKSGILYPSKRSVTLSINSFEKGLNLKYDKTLLSMDYASDIANLSFDQAALKEPNGFIELSDRLGLNAQGQESFNSVGSLLRVFYFYKYNKTELSREDKLVFISSDFEVYYLNLLDEDKQLIKLTGIKFTSLPVAQRYRLNGEDVLIFSSETDNMVVWDGNTSPYTVLDAPKISSMTIHYERLFATVDGEKNSVWFSDDLDPTNWNLGLDEAGFIELIDERGQLLKVVSFLDYVYIFREHGISRLTAFGDQTQFSVSNLFVSSGKINPNSVCVCEDKILFLASDGLYKFDGVDTVKILDQISNGFQGVDNDNAVACYNGNSYYLACNFITTSSGLNTLLEIDANSYTLKSITRNIQIKYMLSTNLDGLNGVVAIIFNNQKNAFIPAFIVKNGKLFSENLEKVWCSPVSNLGDGYFIKVLKNIYVSSLNPISIEVIADNKTFAFNFSGNNRLSAKKCYIPLYNFAFKIKTSSDQVDVKNIKFEFVKLGRSEL